MLNYRLFFHINTCLYLILLTACGNDNFTDLNTYIANIKAQPKGAIESLPETKVVEPFLFSA